AGLESPDTRHAATPGAPSVRWAEGAMPELRRFPGWLGSVDEIDRAAAGRGLISSDSAGRVVRRVPLIADVAGTATPALSLEMWRVAAGVRSLTVSAPSQGLMQVSFADAHIPVQADGTIWVRYGRHDPARFVSAAEVLAGTADPELFASKLVLV